MVMDNNEDKTSLRKPCKLVAQERKSCSICGRSDLSEIQDLPGLPLTGMFVREPQKEFIKGIDQKLLFCSFCQHGQLYRQVSPEILYNSEHYFFKTSKSTTARAGTQLFVGFLESLLKGKRPECILDVGCNDLYLLDVLSDMGRYKVGVDPIWSSKSPEKLKPDTFVYGGKVEDIDLENKLPKKPDLVICRHTLEHVYDPVSVIQRIMEISSDDALFVFEVPAFDSLVNRNRFDQVFHEHLQYFSRHSWEVLIEKCGASLLGVSENYHNWGAVMVGFSKNHIKRQFSLKNISKLDETSLKTGIKIFQDQIATSFKLLEILSQKGNIYGYGAALMLPILAYHMKTDFSILDGVFDDNPDKKGLYYLNLPVKVLSSSGFGSFKESTILLTALDNVQPILTKLLMDRPKNIVYPLHLI